MKSTYVSKSDFETALLLLTPVNRLVMRTAAVTGLRIGDVLSLKSVQLYMDRFTIREAKTGKKRRVRLPYGLKCDLQRVAGHTYVFEGRDSGRKHRTRQAVWADLHRAAVALRVAGNLTPHSARKRFAVELYKKYNDMERVKRILNHTSTEVTMLYALADVLSNRKPRR